MKDIYGLEIDEKDQVFTSVKDINSLVICEVAQLMPNSMKLKVVGVFSPSERYFLGKILTRKPHQVVRQTESVDSHTTMYVKED